MAWRLARDLPTQGSIRLGAGLPQLLCEFTTPASDDAGVADLVIVTADAVDAAGAIAGTSMPLAARECWVIAPLYRPDGLHTLVEHCAQPVPGLRATRLYSDIAIFDLQDGKVFVRAVIEGITLQTLQMELDVELQVSPELTLLQIPLSMGGIY